MRWLLPDQEGSIRDVVSNAGTVLDHLAYDSFGNVTSPNSSNAPDYRYAGYRWDNNTGLYDTYHRFYNPVTGTFLSQDPSGFSAGCGGGARFFFCQLPLPYIRQQMR